jgi:hypothetical protein
VAQLQNGGCKPTFARYMSERCDDLDSLAAEAATAIAALQICIRMTRADADGHCLVARGSTCRVYHRNEPAYRELLPPSAA